VRLQRPGWMLLVAVIGASVPAPVAGQLPNPRLYGLIPSGGRCGSTVEVAVRGEDLDEPETITFSHPGISGTLKATDLPAWQRPPDTPFVVTIARDVPPGIYEARVAGRFGLSTSWPFVVGDLPVRQETPGNDTSAKATSIEPDTVIEGELAGNKVDYYRFTGAPGQRFVLVCESRPLHGRFDLMAQVTGPGERMLGSVTATRSGDPVIPLTVRDAGEHLIRFNDATFRAADPKETAADRYRFILSSRPYLVRVWPPVVAAGSSGPHRLLGYLLPGGRPVGRQGLEEIDVVVPPIPATTRRSGEAFPLTRLAALGVDAGSYRLPGPPASSNQVPVVVAASPPLVEVEPNDRAAPQPLTVPCDVVGRFDAAGDSDWYVFEAAKGNRFAVEVLAERIDAVADVALVVEQVSRDAKGKEQVKVVVEQDDPPRRFTHPPCDFETSDPRLVFTADRSGSYRLGVRNLVGGSFADTAAVYRLTIRPPAADFHLLAAVGDLGTNPGEGEDTTLHVPTIPRLRRGGRVPIVVQVHRVDGFDGPVTLGVDGLPPGVTCQPVGIAAGVDEGAVVLEAGADVAAWRGPIRVFGTARIGTEDRRHAAAWAAVTWSKKQKQQTTSARLVDDMPLDVSSARAPLRVSVSQAAFGPVPRGGKVTIPFTVETTAEMKGPVRVEVRELPAAKPGPPYPKAIAKSLESGQKSGAIEVTIPADTPAGEHSIHLVAQVTLPLVRNPDALAAATASLAEFEDRRTALQNAVATAKQQADAAAAAARAAAGQANGPAKKAAMAEAEAARKAADQAVSKAKAAVDAHLQNEKPLTQQVGSVKKANESKPVVVFAASAPIRLTVTAK